MEGNMSNLIDLELSGKTFSDLMLARARTLVFYEKDPITLQKSDDGIIDHIEFDDGVGVTQSPVTYSQTINVLGGGQDTVSANKIRIILPFRIFVKLISVAKDPSKEPTDYFVPNGVPATVTLDLSMTGSPPKMCVEVVDWALKIDLGPSFKMEHDKVLKNLQAGGPLCFPFDASQSLQNALPTLPPAQNALLFATYRGLNVGLVSLKVRIEFSPQPRWTKQDWQAWSDTYSSTLVPG